MLSDLHDAIAKVCPISGVYQTSEGDYGINFADEATEEQKIAAMDVLKNWVDKPLPRLVWALEFLDRFPESTQLAVVAAAQSNPAIRLWYDRLLANGSVDLDNERLRAGLNAMRDAGLLTQEMIDAALA
jgi:hypothetical protein